MEIGELVGRGRTSEVYAYGEHEVVKVPHVNVPADWPDFEAALTIAVREAGAPAPAVGGVVEVDGRRSVVFERIEGPSMWQQMVQSPDDAPQLARDLAAIHRSLLTIGIPPGLPDLVDRLKRKAQAATLLSGPDRQEAVDLIQELPRGAALLHGDLHPGNVLVGPQGPVVIDWFDAAIGHPIADVVRSSILMQPSTSVAPTHLPDAPADLLGNVHQAYLHEFRTDIDSCEQVAAWQAVVAVGRLAEGAEVDTSRLVALWQAR